jgi:arylamine N-acetyltransferase
MAHEIRYTFERIFGPLRSSDSEELLQRIAERFSLIPYENVTKIIQTEHYQDAIQRLRMPDQLLEDHQMLGAGGTCFSLTYCLRSIVEAYGYSSEIHMADLARGTNNHCTLIVKLDDQQFLIDPGYLITTPLPLPESGSILHETRLHPVRLERDAHGQDLFLSTLEPDGEKYRYRLNPSASTEEEFRKYWIESFSWPMMHSILISRATEAGRLYLHDRYLRKVSRDQKQSQKIKENFDLQIAQATGISPEMIAQARRILARSKRELIEKTENVHG